MLGTNDSGYIFDVASIWSSMVQHCEDRDSVAKSPNLEPMPRLYTGRGCRRVVSLSNPKISTTLLHRSRVATCGGLEALCGLVNASQSDAVLACAAAALGNFADDDQNRCRHP
jgi:hypothetical protein